LRITISNPGRDRGAWKFETDDYSLRGQACRPALARTNSPGELPGG